MYNFWVQIVQIKLPSGNKKSNFCVPQYQSALQITESPLSPKSSTDNCLLLLLIQKHLFASILVCRCILWLATELLQSKWNSKTSLPSQILGRNGFLANNDCSYFCLQLFTFYGIFLKMHSRLLDHSYSIAFREILLLNSTTKHLPSERLCS